MSIYRVYRYQIDVKSESVGIMLSLLSTTKTEYINSGCNYKQDMLQCGRFHSIIVILKCCV